MTRFNIKKIEMAFEKNDKAFYSLFIQPSILTKTFELSSMSDKFLVSLHNVTSVIILKELPVIKYQTKIWPKFFCSMLDIKSKRVTRVHSDHCLSFNKM